MCAVLTPSDTGTRTTQRLKLLPTRFPLSSMQWAHPDLTIGSRSLSSPHTDPYTPAVWNFGSGAWVRRSQFPSTPPPPFEFLSKSPPLLWFFFSASPHLLRFCISSVTREHHHGLAAEVAGGFLLFSQAISFASCGVVFLSCASLSSVSLCLSIYLHLSLSLFRTPEFVYHCSPLARNISWSSLFELR